MGKQERATTELLRTELDDILKAAVHLRRSSERLKTFTSWEEPSEDECDQLDIFVSRFARLSDLLFQKAFRLIDKLELVESGTLIDALNRAEKRGIIDSADDFRDMRHVRNQLTHNYSGDDMPSIAKKLFGWTPALLTALDNTTDYSSRLIQKLNDSSRKS